VRVRACERLTDMELVQRVRQDDEAAFEELMRRYEDKSYGLALRLTGSPEDALEVAQDAFFKAYKAIDRFQGSSSFSTWLYAITLNTARNQIRSRNRRGHGVTISMDEDRDDLPRMDPVSRDPSPSEELQERALRQEYEKALDRLSHPFKETILLRDIEGLSYEEIAVTLGVNPGTVKSRISRGRDELRKILSAQGLLEVFS